MTRSDYEALRLIMSRAQGSRLSKERALKAFEKAWKAGKLRIPAETPEQRWLRCETKFWLGDYSDWSGWECRSEWARGIWYHNPFPVPVWDGSQKRVLVVGEQGIGDEVCFSQALWELESPVFATDPRLVPVYERHGFECVPTVIHGETRVKPEVPDGVEAWVSLGELVRAKRRDRSAFPRTAYLHAAPEQVARFKAYKGRTAISWRGAQGQYALKDFLAFGDLSLQYDQEWDEDCERPDVDVRNDIEGLMGVLANVDRLVTVSNSTAHFAAAMGVQVDLVLAWNGVRRNTLLWPWKWWCEPLKKSVWYGDNVRVFQNLHDYRARAGAQGLRGRDRSVSRDSDEKPEMAARSRQAAGLPLGLHRDDAADARVLPDGVLGVSQEDSLEPALG